MSESLPKCRWCNELPVTHPMTDGGVFMHPGNGCPSGLGHPAIRLPLSEDQWRTLNNKVAAKEDKEQPGNVMDTLADARDAARYRWLRDSDNFPIDEGPGPSSWDELCELDTNQFDEWVDKAMTHPPQEECEHGKGLTDYCEPCGRIHNN